MNLKRREQIIRRDINNLLCQYADSLIILQVTKVEFLTELSLRENQVPIHAQAVAQQLFSL